MKSTSKDKKDSPKNSIQNLKDTSGSASKDNKFKETGFSNNQKQVLLTNLGEERKQSPSPNQNPSPKPSPGYILSSLKNNSNHNSNKNILYKNGPNQTNSNFINNDKQQPNSNPQNPLINLQNSQTLYSDSKPENPNEITTQNPSNDPFSNTKSRNQKTFLQDPKIFQCKHIPYLNKFSC